MARYDKYDPKAGGFRARVAEDWETVDGLAAVGLDTDGHVVAGAGNTGIVGVLSVPEAKQAGDVVDVMTHGEVVEFDGDPGTVYNGTDAGAVVTGAGTRLGHTVEATRLVVRVDR